MILVVPLFNYIETSFGQSMALERSVNDFNFSLITDFIREYDGGLQLFIQLVLSLLIFYFMISIFLMGGILDVLVRNPHQYSAGTFLNAAVQYFWRYTRLTLYFLIGHVVILLVFWNLFSSQGLNPLKIESDHALIARVKQIFPLYLGVATTVMLMSDYAKVYVYRMNRSLITIPLINSFKHVFRHFLNAAGLYLVNMVVMAFFFLLYFLARKNLDTRPGHLLLLAFLLSQLYLLIRIGLKLVNLRSIALLSGMWSKDTSDGRV